MDCRMTMIRTTKRSISQKTGNIVGILGREESKTLPAYREFLGPTWIGLMRQKYCLRPMIPNLIVNRAIGEYIDSNDDYATHVESANLPVQFIPTNAAESVIMTTLEPGAYTVYPTPKTRFP